MEQLHITLKSGSISDFRVKKNAICDDWPHYLRRCENTLVVNSQGEMALNKDSKKSSKFNGKP